MILADSSWKDVFHDVVSHPCISAAVSGVLGLLYLYVRSQGYDILPSVLRRLGIKAVKNTYDISGKWEYICTGIDQKLEHGGECTIELITSVFGVHWKLSGERRWLKQFNQNKEIGVRILDPPFPWSTDFGAFASKASILYTYTITKKNNTIRGFGEGTIETGPRGRPSIIKGRFYQLPPDEPVYGQAEFRRMLHESDYKWNPREIEKQSVVIHDDISAKPEKREKSSRKEE